MTTHQKRPILLECIVDMERDAISQGLIQLIDIQIPTPGNIFGGPPPVSDPGSRSETKTQCRLLKCLSGVACQSSGRLRSSSRLSVIKARDFARLLYSTESSEVRSRMRSLCEQLVPFPRKRSYRSSRTFRVPICRRELRVSGNTIE
jgi:hypothetical protein